MKRAMILCGFLFGSSVSFLQAQPSLTGSWEEEEISFANGNVQLAGTLTLPTTERPYPAVVLLTMGGPQTRDEEFLGFKFEHAAERRDSIQQLETEGKG